MRLINLLFRCCNWVREKDNDSTSIDINHPPDLTLKKIEDYSSLYEKNNLSESLHSISEVKLEVSKKEEQENAEILQKAPPKNYPKIHLINLEVSPDPIVLFEKKDKNNIKVATPHKKKAKKKKSSEKALKKEEKKSEK
ncbi:unnamed protein product [Blepharisma stoltei]|uniref:Uncharacterized protein n=1 Tax=Blepharisma stoltei TaxID=1481888 RepID=A0AAU9K667_9CILI|nr:unnamed protein product [Blepharisma stoltei]